MYKIILLNNHTFKMCDTIQPFGQRLRLLIPLFWIGPRIFEKNIYKIVTSRWDCNSFLEQLTWFIEKSKQFITVRRRSCGKVMFLHLPVSHSVHRGGVCLSACWDTHSPGQTCPWADYSPSAQCMLGYTHPLPSACRNTHPHFPAQCMLG